MLPSKTRKINANKNITTKSILALNTIDISTKYYKPKKIQIKRNSELFSNIPSNT